MATCIAVRLWAAIALAAIVPSDSDFPDIIFASAAEIAAAAISGTT